VKNRDIKINLGAVQETLILPLWARAREMEKNNPIVFDTYARDIVAKIDYDFSTIEAGQVADHQVVYPIRDYNFDNIVKTFLAQNSSALVVNIGAGLDTTFQRVDNGNVLWINIDMPDVVALRNRLIPDSEREMTIAKSVFDFTWMDDITNQKKDRSIFLMAAGVLCYFEAQEVEKLFRKLAEAYPSAHFIFDSYPWFTAWGINWRVMKDSGMDSSARIKWHLKRASRLRRWVNTIRIIEEYPMLSRVPARNDLRKKMIWGIRIANLLRLYNMVHLQL